MYITMYDIHLTLVGEVHAVPVHTALHLMHYDPYNTPRTGALGSICWHQGRKYVIYNIFCCPSWIFPGPRLSILPLVHSIVAMYEILFLLHQVAYRIY